MRNLLLTILQEFLYFQNNQISILQEVWKYRTPLIVEILNSKYYISYAEMYELYAFMYVGKHVC